MPRYVWLAAPLALSEFLLPGSFAALILAGYALLAMIHKLTGIGLHPLWFRCVIWTVSAALLAALPVSGLAFFPIGALLTDLRRRSVRRVRPADDGRPSPAWVAFSS